MSLWLQNNVLAAFLGKVSLIMHKVFLCRKEKHARWRGEAERRRREGVGVILSHCLIGCPTRCCICAAGVTDARGRSARLGSASSQSPCQKCCSRTHRAHKAAWTAQRKGVGVDGKREWWRTVVDTAGGGKWSTSSLAVRDLCAFRGLTCLAPVDAWFKDRLQPHPV